MRRQLTQVLAVHVLRALLAEQPALSPGWLGALADQRIGAALTVRSPPGSTNSSAHRHWNT